MDQAQLDQIIEQHEKWLHTEGESGQRADLSGLSLSGLDLYHRCLNGAKLCGTVFRGCLMEGAVFNDADLRGADLRGAEYYSIYVTGANLVGAQIDSPRVVEGEYGGYQVNWLKFNNMGLYDRGREAWGTIDSAMALQFLLDYGTGLISQLDIV